VKLKGNGIAAVDLLVKRDFRPRTDYALGWAQVSDGNWKASDRGAASDVYASSFEVYGKYAKLKTVLDAIQVNRTNAAPNDLTIESVTTGEQIFGADVDYSTHTHIAITKMGRIKQQSWKGFSLDMEARALSPSFTGSASLPALSYVSVGYEGDRDMTLSPRFAYDNTATYIDESADAGTLTMVVTLTVANMRNLRRYLATVRGAAFNMASPGGVAYPFGPRGDTGTISVKCIDFEDMGMWGIAWWRAKLKLAETV
jgi:hypothetical protein